jgi:hypothetical protein
MNLVSRRRLNRRGAVASIVGIPLISLLAYTTQVKAGNDSVNVRSSNQSGGITAYQVNIMPQKGLEIAQAIIQDTRGWCSPAVGQAGGNVTINCQGVDPHAMQLLNERLNRTNLDLQEKTRQANELAAKYNQLSQQTERVKDDKLATRVKVLLSDLKLEEADALLRKSAISMAQYAAIQDGMSYQEVVKIFGRPGVENAKAGNVTSYAWQNADGSMAAITFIDDRVGSKGQNGLR